LTVEGPEIEPDLLFSITVEERAEQGEDPPIVLSLLGFSHEEREELKVPSVDSTEPLLFVEVEGRKITLFFPSSVLVFSKGIEIFQALERFRLLLGPIKEGAYSPLVIPDLLLPGHKRTQKINLLRLSRWVRCILKEGPKVQGSRIFIGQGERRDET
jgi:hypothetical protein